MAEAIELSIIIPTRNRCTVLIHTLERMGQSLTHLCCEILVVDNGSSDETVARVSELQRSLPIRLLHEPRQGKSRCLNLAVTCARGSLIAFTDDDVLVSSDWAHEILRGSAMYPQAAAFCGPIHPVYPVATPLWLTNPRYASAAFAHFAPEQSEGQLKAPLLPFGPNLAIRARVAEYFLFRHDLGPSEYGPYLCEDTDFALRLREHGGKIMFLPKASVEHRFREGLIELSVQNDRFFYLGRSRILARLPVVALQNFEIGAEESANQQQRGLALNFNVGQLCQLLLAEANSQASLIATTIKRSGWTGASGELGAAARAWMIEHRAMAAHFQLH